MVWRFQEPGLGSGPGARFSQAERRRIREGLDRHLSVVYPRADLAQIEATRSPWMRFVRLLRPHKPVLGYLILATLVIQVLGIAPRSFSKISWTASSCTKATNC